MPVSEGFTWNGEQLKAQARAAAAQGLNQAAERLLALAVPLTPDLTGTLADSGQVQYDTPYAVRQHEELDYHHTHDPHPQAQAKYLEAPATEHAQELAAIIAANVRRGL